MSVCSSLTFLPTFGAMHGGNIGAQIGGKPPPQGEGAKAIGMWRKDRASFSSALT